MTENINRRIPKNHHRRLKERVLREYRQMIGKQGEFVGDTSRLLVQHELVEAAIARAFDRRPTR